MVGDDITNAEPVENTSLPQRGRKTFLARPFYRDWVLSAVIICMGFTLGDYRGPLAGWPGLAVMAVGGCIFVAATVNGLMSLVKR